MHFRRLRRFKANPFHSAKYMKAGVLTRHQNSWSEQGFIGIKINDFPGEIE
jgi:hypothetical protein